MTDADSVGVGIVHVHTVGVPVSDQGRALDFYANVLGLTPRLDVPMGEGRRWIEVAPPEATTSIALVAAHEGVPSGVETGVRLAVGDADAAHAGLVAHDADVDEVLRWPRVPPMFSCRDP